MHRLQRKIFVSYFFITIVFYKGFFIIYERCTHVSILWDDKVLLYCTTLRCVALRCVALRYVALR